jgi:kinesin family protein 3/17
MGQVNSELDDMQEIIHRERDDLMERIRELTREIRMKHLIIDQFTPANEYMRIEKRAVWNEDINDWIIPNSEYTGNNIRIQKAKKKEGKGVNNQLFENILNIDGESEEEDFEQAATKRVNEAINSILVEEDEETQINY